MNRSWTLFLDPRLLVALALGGLVWLGRDMPLATLAWGGAAVAVLLAAWLVGRLLVRRATPADAALPEPATDAPAPAAACPSADIEAMRTRMREAVRLVETSRLGEATGRAALYELPWCMVIGGPASGKSTAIARSGLAFPFSGAGAGEGKGARHEATGTRDCDWFFTSEGILLDTAGRFALGDDADRSQWLGLLSLLKKERPRAPLNGVVVAASLAELSRAAPEAATRLAKQLRQRLQELTETLELVAPVYLVFTKADRIAGFDGFFADADGELRESVWGATLPSEPATPGDAAALFERHFDALCEGLREMAITRLSVHRGKALPPAVLSFPLEFAALGPPLRAFVAELFEDNPYQHMPLWRGFYFASAASEGPADGQAGERVARQFGLDRRAEGATAGTPPGAQGFFLKDFYSRVVFADRALVRRHASGARRRARALGLCAGVAALALALGGWTWSYLANRQLAEQARADLDKAVLVQRDRTDLASRIEALEILQDRIERLERHRAGRPLALGVGLDQARAIETRLREEYFAGLQQVMLDPVAQALENFLGEVDRHAARLQPMTRTPASAAAPLATAAGAAKAPVAAALYAEASPESVEDAYNALKTYLMLGDPSRREAAHLSDQLARFWRGWLETQRGTMSRDRTSRSAERMIAFAAANLADPAFPLLAVNAALVDRTRDNLRRVIRGMPARERVYADVKARAATRFPQVTVARIVGEADRDLVTGSHAISGAFTREAWQGYVEAAFKEAATRELQSADWVLRTAARDDLTLEGSPEQIGKALAELYKAEYAAEWRRFVQGVSVADFGSFEGAVARLNRLGDPALSPLRKVVQAVHEQTSWDDPSLAVQRTEDAPQGAVDWVRQTVLRQAPVRAEAKPAVGVPGVQAPIGPVGREFAAVARLMAPREDGRTRMAAYVEALSKVRTRFNEMKSQGDPGPGALRLMSATFAGTGSELADALRQVDEQMLADASEGARATLRPLLVRPLMQAFGALLAPGETELNRVWVAQVQDPFQRTLAPKYPFDRAARLEAAPAEMAQLFGPQGAIARFAGETLAPVVTRRGDVLAARTWADAGVRLRPEFVAGFAGWVAPLEGAAARGAVGAGADPAAASQTVFQILPQPAPGLAEYTIEIDGQTLRYRNAAANWERFAWPNPGGVPGARISAVTEDGRSIELLDEPGNFALNRMFERAWRKPLGDNLYELSWGSGTGAVRVQLRIVSRPGAVEHAGAAGRTGPSPQAGAGGRLHGMRLPALVAGTEPPAAAPGVGR